MKIYGFEKLSLVDFDGMITCTIFVGGCNFACPFCHNSSLVLNPASNQEVRFEEVMEYLNLRKKIVDAVCITGGEPTIYPDLGKYFKIFKGMGFITKLDTNGTNPEVIKSLVREELVDYVAMDVKNSLSSYQKTIGKNNPELVKKVQESINYLLEGHVDYEFRTTIVKQLHTKEDIIEMGKMLKGAKKLFLQHFIASENCIQKGLSEITKEQANEFIEILKEYVPNVSLRGY